MGSILSLERFDEHSKGGLGAEDKIKGSFDDGYREGWEAAEIAWANNQTQLRASVVESFSDANFGYAEAQAHYLAGMTSYVTALVETVLPAVLHPAFHAQLRAMLLEALKRDSEGPIAIHLPTGQVEAFEAAVADLDLMQMRLIPDENLSDHAAFMSETSRETSLDLDAVKQAIREHTAILLKKTKKAS